MKTEINNFAPKSEMEKRNGNKKKKRVNREKKFGTQRTLAERTLTQRQSDNLENRESIRQWQRQETEKQIKFSLHIRVHVVFGFCIVLSPHSSSVILLLQRRTDVCLNFACNFGERSHMVILRIEHSSFNVSYWPLSPLARLRFMCDVRWVWRSSFRPQNSCMFEWARSCLPPLFTSRALASSHDENASNFKRFRSWCNNVCASASECKMQVPTVYRSSSSNHNRPRSSDLQIFFVNCAR